MNVLNVCVSLAEYNDYNKTVIQPSNLNQELCIR